jgi:hypothetical protein
MPYDLEAFNKDPYKLGIMFRTAVITDEIQEQKMREQQSISRFAAAMDRAKNRTYYPAEPATFSHPDEVRPTVGAAPGSIPLDKVKSFGGAMNVSKTTLAKVRSVEQNTENPIRHATFGGGGAEVAMVERGKQRIAEEKEVLDYMQNRVVQAFDTIHNEAVRGLDLAFQDVDRLKAKIERGDQSLETRKKFEEAYNLVGKLSQQMYGSQDRHERPGIKIEGVACADQCVSDLAEHTQSQIEKARERLRRPAIAEGRLS